MWTQVRSDFILILRVRVFPPSPYPEQDLARLQGQHQPPPQADLRHAEGSLRQGAPPPQG